MEGKNKNIISVLLVATILGMGGFWLFSASVQAAAGINRQINFQGKVTNTDGTNVTNGSYTFLFCLYTTGSPATACTSGANNDAVWRESKSITVTDGIFQTDLGDTTTLPGSVDFNTDNIYLGINFNANGQMTPLVRFTAAPYAMNADKVHGLTVTDTTGTLTVANGKTVSFADAFSTSGAFPMTLTATASTTATLPSGTITIADLATAQTLTNKTIGSTGLVFSGATTDMTTATGEDLTLTAAGVGVISLNDSVSVTGTSLTATSATTVTLGSTGTDTITIGNGGADTITIGNVASTGVSITDDNWGITSAGAATFAGITSAGTISAGIWQGTAIGAQYGGTGLNTSASTGVPTISSGTWSVDTNYLSLAHGGTNASLTASNGGIVYSTASALSVLAANANSGLALVSGGAGAPTWFAPTVGSVVFATTNGALSSDNTSFYYDLANHRLGLGDTTPDAVFDLNLVSTNATAGTEYSFTNTISDTGVVTSGTDSTYGGYTTVTRTGTGGTAVVNNYGQYISVTGDTGGTSTNYGLYVDVSGADTNYAASFQGGAVAIGPGMVSIGSTSLALNAGYGNSAWNANATAVGSNNVATYDRTVAVGYGNTATTAGYAIAIGANNTSTSDNASAFGYGNTVSALNASAFGNGITNGTANSTMIGPSNTAKVTILSTGYTGIGDSTPAALLTVGSGDLFQVNSSGAIAAVVGITSTGAIAANAGITFDASTDTVGAHTLSGTLDANTNILENIGNTGTDFIASTGALTLAGVLTANGGISLAASQSLTGGAASFIDLASVTHGTTANQGLRLPNAASATPSNPTSGEGYLAWDAAGNQLITYNGTAWTTLSGGGMSIGGSITSATEGSVLFAGASGVLNQNNGQFFWDNTNFRLGLGDATPDAILDLNLASTSTTAGTEYGSTNTVSDTGIVTTGTDTTYGDYTTVTRTGATGGTINNYGQYISLTGDTGGTSTNTGLYVNVSGADANYAAVFNGGFVGINTTSAGYAAFGVLGTGTSYEALVNPAMTYIQGLASGGAAVNFVVRENSSNIETELGSLNPNGGYVGTATNHNFAIKTNDTDKVTILSGGNVGVGDTTPAALFTVGNGDLFQVDSSGVITAVAGITSSGAIAANGGITFDASTDTVGAHTLSGTIDANTNILTNIGNTGTDFVASTGALTLAGVLTANGGISLSASQSISAASAAFVDLALITHGTTANQGLRLPNAASASPSSPTSGEGYLAWDAAGNQLITYNGSGWTTVGGVGSGYNLVKDETTSLTSRTTLAFLGAGVTCTDSGSQTECTIAGGSGADLAGTYNTGAAGNQTITLDGTQDSIIVSNPASAGTDSAFTFGVEQLNTGIANDAIKVDNRGIGNGLRIDDASGDTTPFIVDGNGAVGIGTENIAAYNGVTNTTKLQIGSATSRGDAVVYGDYLRKGLNDHTALANIQSVFVYDTTRDSDGGAWINNPSVQGASWYVETKDDGPGDACALTDDRCGRAAFPRKAILVATTSAMYIFDAQDGSMWMKFDQDAAGSCVTGPCALGTNTNNDPSSVFGINGVVYVGTKGSSPTGMYAIDFYNDRIQNFDSVDRTNGDKNIASRNTVVAYSSGAITALSIFSNVVNDIHGANMYGSSITQTNGGPLNGNLFIAVATDDAAQVINMTSGRVLRYADGATTDDINQVWVTRRGRLYLVNETLAEIERYNDIETSVANDAGPDDIWDEATGNLPNAFKTAPTVATTADAMWVLERETYAEGTADTAKADVVYVGHSQGLTEIHDVNAPSGTVIGWSKFYDTNRITPYMSGTPRGMFSFNETTGDLVDSTIRNSVLEPEVAPTYGVNGVRGTGLSFNGTSQFLCSDANNDGTCDVDTDFDTAAISFHVSLWFKHPTAMAGTDVLVDKRYPTLGGAEGIGYTIEMSSTGNIIFGIQDTAATAAYDDSVTSTLAYNDNQWHNVTAVNTDAALCLYIDGRLAVACDTTLAATATLSGNILTIGADGSGAAGGNFWDGQIDDVYFAGGGATTSDTLTQAQARRMYNDGVQALRHSSVRVTDATTATSTTIGDSGEAWVLNQFAGSIVEITSDTGVGQTRRVTGNTATTLTVSPAFSTTPDTTSDFEIIPEQLYGSSNTVTSVAVTDTNFLGKMRERYVGTSDGADGGGVSVFQGYGSGYITDVFHGDSEKTDDGGTEWTGTDFDDVTSISVAEDAVVFGSLAGVWIGREDESFDQSIDQIITNIDSIQKELLVDGLLGTSPDTGVLGGADLAERYYSNESLEAGELVSVDTSLDAGVKRTTGAYQRDVIGVVATQPGIILGTEAENSYPIALVGRVPVKVTNQNGWPAAGERLTASTVSGYAMRATQAGRVIGQVLNDPVPGDFAQCPIEYGLGEDALCGTAMVFVNLADYSGMPVELAMQQKESLDQAGIVSDASADAAVSGLDAGDAASIRLAAAEPTKEEKILAFLKTVRDENEKKNMAPSEIFTGRVAASDEVITPTLYADQIFAKSIKADSIEGLQIFTDQIGSLEEKYAGLEAAAGAQNGSSEAASVVKEQLSIAMKKLSVDSFVVQMDGSILGKLSVAGALRIGGDAEFAGETVFSKLASFIGDAVFSGKTTFEQAPTFGSDTAGFAVIKKGERKVRVPFGTAYERQPIVAVSMTNDVSPLLDDEADKDLRADIALVEQEYLDTVFAADMKYIVTEKGKDGFTIVLNQKAPADLRFSWVAVAVKKANVSVSEEEKETEEADQIVPLPAVDTTVPGPAPFVEESAPSVEVPNTEVGATTEVLPAEPAL